MRGFWWALPLGLIALLYLQWSGWPPPPTWTLASPPPAGAEPGRDLLAEFGPLIGRDLGRDRSAYAEVIDRPLFLPDRRPPAPVTSDEPVAEPASLDGLDLVAIIMTPDLTMAWVKDAANPKLLQVRPGEELVGWTVREIRPDRLALERQGLTDTLLLRTFTAEPATAEPQRRADPRTPRPGSRLRPPPN